MFLVLTTTISIGLNSTHIISYLKLDPRVQAEM